MGMFVYTAYDQSGAKVSGQIEATSEQEALAQLETQRLIPLEVKPQTTKTNVSLFSQKVTLSDLEFLTAELSLLLESGVRIDKGIDIIKRTKAKPALAKLLGDLSNDLKKGASLSQAAGKHPEIFDQLYINLIELGEASGELSKVFDGLARDLKFRRDLQRKVTQALTYPAVILSVCVLCVIFIFNFIVPKMSGLFADAQNLPWYTQALLDLSDWLQNYQLYLAGALVLAGIGFSQLLKQAEFKSKLHQSFIKWPIVKNAIITAERIRFNSGLAMMLSSGVAIDKALTLAAGSVKNTSIQKDMLIVRNKVKSGESLSFSLKQSPLYPDFYISLLEVGEESGELARIFDEISTRSRQDFEEWTQKLTTLIEPLLILLMGAIVGGVVVVMLMSMVSVNDIGI